MTGGRAGTVLDRAMPEWRWSEFRRVAMPAARGGPAGRPRVSTGRLERVGGPCPPPTAR